jgi:L-aminopeptidase/D-esterase-like protein
MKEITLTDIKGLLVGHCESQTAKTGCTVIIAPDGAVASGSNPGFAPGSRETDLLKPENSVQKIQGLCFAGGSAFGLAAAGGVVRFLRERGLGYDTGSIKVPLVPAAVIYDYPYNQSGGLLPDESMGYEAAKSASVSPVESGPYGAGYSAASGKIGEPDLSSLSGIGSYGLEVTGLQIAALAVVNPLGSIIDPENGSVISGLRTSEGGLASREEIIGALAKLPVEDGTFRSNTVIVAVATNASLSKLGLYRLSLMAATGLARTLYPAHTLFDGDTVFALSTCTGPTVSPSWLGALAAEVVSRAILKSVLVN